MSLNKSFNLSGFKFPQLWNIIELHSDCRISIKESFAVLLRIFNGAEGRWDGYSVLYHLSKIIIKNNLKILRHLKYRGYFHSMNSALGNRGFKNYSFNLGIILKVIWLLYCSGCQWQGWKILWFLSIEVYSKNCSKISFSFLALFKTTGTASWFPTCSRPE